MNDASPSSPSAPAELLGARYGTAASLAPAWNPVIEGLLGHRSVRAFLPEPVTEAELQAMIAAAQSASSSSNLHAWSVVAVQEPARRAALADLAGEQAHIRIAPLQLVWLADLARLEHIAGQLGRPAAALDYLEMLLVGVVDAALAAQNAVVAAESLGLGTVYIGAMRNRPEEVARLLELPPRVVAVFGLCVGHPDPALPAAIKPRPPQEVVLHRETYSLPSQDAGVAAYNEIMGRFYDAQGMKVHGTWAVHSSKRVAGPESLSGRDRLVQALHALGFPLR
jgi:nitroreductase